MEIIFQIGQNSDMLIAVAGFSELHKEIGDDFLIGLDFDAHRFEVFFQFVVGTKFLPDFFFVFLREQGAGGLYESSFF